MQKLLVLPLLALSPLGTGALGAQSLSVGVIGGAPFSDVTTSGAVSGLQSIQKSTNFTIGPALQVNLPLSLRLEVDALFRPYHVTITGLNVVDDISAQQWRFPVLLQYRFKAPLVSPFVEAGLSFEHLSGISAAAKSAIASGPGALLHQSDAGVVLGVGVDAKVPFVRLSGELRYTRATTSELANFSNLNQAEVIVGVHF
ncbi:MAG TPA: outer membrane beta-barrel protein [Bryobacteraceae bacterium]|nr:outer membrane beta-barrel protein [Bryobacteraceae bacterium]